MGTAVVGPVGGQRVGATRWGRVRGVGGDSGSGGIGGGDSEERGACLLQGRNYVSDNVPQSETLLVLCTVTYCATQHGILTSLYHHSMSPSQVGLHYPTLPLHEILSPLLPLSPLPLLLLLLLLGLHATLTLLPTHVAL